MFSALKANKEVKKLRGKKKEEKEKTGGGAKMAEK